MKRAETKDRIRQALEIRGIKQSELVERTGIDKGQMSSYLSGKYKPRQKNIDLIRERDLIKNFFSTFPIINEKKMK